MDAFMEEEWDAQLIVPSLWLGSERAAHCSLTTIHSHNITHVLVCGFGLLLRHEGEASLTYKKIKAIDLPIFPISQHFEEVVTFIDDAIKSGGTILVHCARGKSRSTTCVLAYLIKFKEMTYREALWHVKSKREIVHVNAGFEKQLMDYEEKCRQRTAIITT